MLRLWHVPAKSPLLLPPAMGLWGCMVAVQSSVPRPSLCPVSACPEDAAARRGRCPGLPFLRSARCGGAPATGIFTSPLLNGVGHAVWGQGTGWIPRIVHPLCGCGTLRFPVPTASCQLTPASPCGGAEGRGWAEPRVVPVRGSRLAPEAPAATSATETLRRVGAARSHLPLIEFICYNPKQCKAGFSQAPAACLPIKIPSRTANPPSRLDIKQPVSKKRQEKSPCVRAEPLLPILLPQGRGPAGLPVPFRVAPGEINALQEDSKLLSVASGQGRLSPLLPTGVFQLGFQSSSAWQDLALSPVLSLPLQILGSPISCLSAKPYGLSCLGCKSPCWGRSWGIAGPWGPQWWAVGGQWNSRHSVEQAGGPGVMLSCVVLLWHSTLVPACVRQDGVMKLVL